MAELGRRDGKAVDLQMVHLEVLLLIVALCIRHQLADLCIEIIHGLYALMIAQHQPACQDQGDDKEGNGARQPSQLQSMQRLLGNRYMGKLAG